MHIACTVQLADFWGVNFVEPIGFADFARDVIVQPLQTIVHIAIFVDAPIEFRKVLIDQINM